MSYNSLFGYGSHSPDASIASHYLLQETSGTAIADRSGNGRNATASGWANPANTTGPKSWLPSAITFNGSSQFVPLPTAVLPGSSAAFTILQRSLTPGSFSGNPTERHSFASDYVGNARSYQGHNASGLYCFRVGDMALATRDALSTSTWYDLAVSYAGGSGGTVTPYINGAAKATATATYGGSAQPTIGCFRTDTPSTNRDSHWNGAVSETATFTRALTAAEISEWGGGPEPLNTVVPTLNLSGSSWSGTTGSWDSQSNGAVTYTWQLRNSSTHSVVQSGTGTPGGTAPADGSYYLWVRGSNAGGHDADEDAISSVEVRSSGSAWFANHATRVYGMGAVL